jgi:peptide deformylase
MALRNIVLEGDEILLKPSREVINFDQRLHVLLDDMRDTLQENNGAGLAAPQVGVLRRVIVIDLGDEGDGTLELVNPVILSADGEQDGQEGCLSVPGKYGMVKRPMNVVISAQDRHGKTFTRDGTEMLARAICHEVDHLDGKLYVDLVTAWVDEDEEHRKQRRKRRDRNRKRRNRGR